MHFLIVFAASAAAVFHTAPFGGRIGPSDFVLVRSVPSGDAIVVSSVGRVRLLGIAAPHIGRRLELAAPFGREARERLTGLLLNRWVRLEPDGAAPSASSSLRAYVVTGDGTFVNAVIVREGLARVTARAGLSRLPELQRAEAEAQAARRGIWGSAQQAPSTGYTRDSKANRPPTSRTTIPSHQRRSTRKKSP